MTTSAEKYNAKVKKYRIELLNELEKKVEELLEKVGSVEIEFPYDNEPNGSGGVCQEIPLEEGIQYFEKLKKYELETMISVRHDLSRLSWGPYRLIIKRRKASEYNGRSGGL